MITNWYVGIVILRLFFTVCFHYLLQHSSRESSPSHSSSPDVFCETSPDEERQKSHSFDLPPGGRATWSLGGPQQSSDSIELPETLSNEGSESTTDADKLDDPSGSEGDQSSSCDMEEESEAPFTLVRCTCNVIVFTRTVL